MALRQTEQVQLDSINQTVKILAGLGHDKSMIESQMAHMIQPLESSANCKLIFKNDEGDARFGIIELKSDYVRTRTNADLTLLSLRAKIFGLPIDIKVKKDGESFTNTQVATSLNELAELVESMPVEMIENPQDDWSRTPGEMPKGLSAEAVIDSDSEDDNETPEAPPAFASEVNNTPQEQATPSATLDGVPSQGAPSEAVLVSPTEQEETAPVQDAQSSLGGEPLI